MKETVAQDKWGPLWLQDVYGKRVINQRMNCGELSVRPWAPGEFRSLGERELGVLETVRNYYN